MGIIILQDAEALKKKNKENQIFLLEKTFSYFFWYNIYTRKKQNNLLTASKCRNFSKFPIFIHSSSFLFRPAKRLGIFYSPHFPHISHKSSISLINHTIFTIFFFFLPITQNAQRIVRIVDDELKPCEDVATQKRETKQNTDVEETEQLEQNTEKRMINEETE